MVVWKVFTHKVLYHLRKSYPLLNVCPKKSLSSKVPKNSVALKIDVFGSSRPKICEEIIDQLEKISLVDFANERGIERLEEAIAFADQICVIDTTGIEPMFSVLEDRSLYLREDKVTEGNCREDILANASVTEEEYFVSPPGNIPLDPKQKD